MYLNAIIAIKNISISERNVNYCANINKCKCANDSGIFSVFSRLLFNFAKKLLNSGALNVCVFEKEIDKCMRK